MSVLITSIKMPETCYECRFCDSEAEYPFRLFCVAHLNRIEDPRSGRLGTCPLEEPPTIDVPDRKVGKWEHHIGIGNVALLKCGECGFTYPELLGMMLFHFCPNCGHPMEVEE